MSVRSSALMAARVALLSASSVSGQIIIIGQCWSTITAGPCCQAQQESDCATTGRGLPAPHSRFTADRCTWQWQRSSASKRRGPDSATSRRSNESAASRPGARLARLRNACW